MNRVVISGIGLVTGLGIGAEQTWQALLDGRGAAGEVTGFDASSLRTRLGVQVPDFDATSFIAKRALRNMTRDDQLAVAGATLAVRDAGPVLEHHDTAEAGLFIGGSKEISDPSKVIDAVLLSRDRDGTTDMARMGTEGAAQFYPLFYVEGLQAASLFYISQAHGLRGANTYFAGAGDAGITAIGRAYRAIRRGEASVAVAGGFDEATSWWNMTKFDALGLMSASNDMGEAACRPYDRDRDGFVPGEGAAFVVLEAEATARRRGAPVYAELTGMGAGFDADGLVTPSPDGEALAGAIGRALGEAGLSPGSVDYVAADGCATPDGDASEAAALRTAFGAAASRIAASSVKAAAGHLMAGAGALNVAVAALAIRHGVIAPTLNLTNIDPCCEGIDWVPGKPRDLQVRHAVALGRGLEGQNVALVLRAAD